MVVVQLVLTYRMTKRIKHTISRSYWSFSPTCPSVHSVLLQFGGKETVELGGPLSLFISMTKLLFTASRLILFITWRPWQGNQWYGCICVGRGGESRKEGWREEEGAYISPPPRLMSGSAPVFNLLQPFLFWNQQVMPQPDNPLPCLDIMAELLFLSFARLGISPQIVQNMLILFSSPRVWGDALLQSVSHKRSALRCFLVQMDI